MILTAPVHQLMRVLNGWKALGPIIICMEASVKMDSITWLFIRQEIAGAGFGQTDQMLNLHVMILNYPTT